MQRHLRLLLTVVLVCALAILPAGLHAQARDLTGTWQGMLLSGGTNLRIVLKIRDGDKPAPRADIYSIDQRTPALPASTFTVQGSAIKLAFTMLGATYTATLASDGSELTGIWTQGGSPAALNMKRTAPADAWAIPEPPPRMPAMDPKADPTFEVATVKPTAPDERRTMITIRGSEAVIVNQTLASLIAFAYGVQQKQVVGAPAWVDADHFDITAKPDLPGTPNEEQFRAMLRKLLVDRFALRFHDDRKELAAYALEPAGSGRADAKLTPSPAEAGNLPGLFFHGLGRLSVTNARIGDFTGLMQSVVLDRPVLDRTGLTGRFDFTLNWTPDESQFGGAGAKAPPPADRADALPPLFTAIQEQLGLKLSSVRAPVPIMAIDHVTPPTGN